jgi:hypothetical protein
MDLSLVVGDRNALAFALEQTGLADDAVGAMNDEGFLASELELGPYGRVVHDIGKLVSRFELEDVHRAHVSAVGTTGALFHDDNDLDHECQPRSRAAPRVI